MAGNFRVVVYRNSDILHLRLEGDFDGSSACQLLCMLADNGTTVKKVFVHTDGLKAIHPFGKAVFEKNLRDFMRQQWDLLFTGNKSSEIAPGGQRTVISNSVNR